MNDSKEDPNPLEDTTNAIELSKMYSLRRIRLGLLATILGYVLFLVGSRPELFGLDRSPVIGFVQIAVFTVGLGIMCLGGYLSLMALWKNRETSIAADIGSRLVSTGFVVSVFCGMADIFGFGTHSLPGLSYFGTWQAGGVFVGQLIICIGFILMVPTIKHLKKTEN